MDRLPSLMRLFPAISHVNVWDLPWCVWLDLAETVDAWEAQQRRNAMRG